MADDVYSGDILETLGRSMYCLDYKDSYGVVILKSGFPINVRKFYEYFRESWNTYQDALKTNDLIALKNFYKETDGGILSNGEIDIDVRQIAATVSAYKFKKSKKESKKPLDDDPEALEFYSRDI